MPDESVSAAAAPAAPAGGPGRCESPVFVLTASRSGSTLLRFILDSHPRLACPPETSIAAACAQLSLSCDVLEHADDETRALDAPVAVGPEALAAVRDVVGRAYDSYLGRRGKQRWCDKSLDNFQYTDLITQLYPDAKFICLYRHCMDVVASAVEACPWGLHRFGLDAFAAQNVGNSVAAVGSYWMSTVQAILDFEERHPEACYRVRYEDLVSAPEETAAGIFSFLAEAQVPGITTECFDIPHEGNGSGDEKLWFTSGVSADSMGRGVVVPADALPEGLRLAINGALAKLGYRTVEGDWNSAPGATDPRAAAVPGDATAGASDASPGDADASASEATRAAAAALADRIAASGAGRANQIVRRWPALAGQTIRIVVANSAQDRQTLHLDRPGRRSGRGRRQRSLPRRRRAASPAGRRHRSRDGQRQRDRGRAHHAHRQSRHLGGPPGRHDQRGDRTDGGPPALRQHPRQAPHPLRRTARLCLAAGRGPHAADPLRERPGARGGHGLGRRTPAWPGLSGPG